MLPFKSISFQNPPCFRGLGAISSGFLHILKLLAFNNSRNINICINRKEHSETFEIVPTRVYRKKRKALDYPNESGNDRDLMGRKKIYFSSGTYSSKSPTEEVVDTLKMLKKVDKRSYFVFYKDDKMCACSSVG